MSEQDEKNTEQTPNTERTETTVTTERTITPDERDPEPGAAVTTPDVAERLAADARAQAHPADHVVQVERRSNDGPDVFIK